MKYIKKEPLTKIKKILTLAYYEKENLEISESWQSRVMGNIQDLGPISQFRFFDVFQRTVWRLTPATCVMILLLSLALTQINMMSDYELVKIFFEDPADFSLLALYNQ